MLTKQKLLDKYRNYDYLNQNKTPLIKITVSYIKPSFLFKTDILTPLHLGREIEEEKSKDGAVSEDDIKWLHKNCFGDDFKDGISKYNRRIGFLTGTFWVWKNYDKLDNPEYFGSFGYRRLFDPSFLSELKENDFIIPKLRKIYRRLNFHGSNMYKNTINVLSNVHPEDTEGFKKYLDRKLVYHDEIYILKKELFFEFCEWIFPIIFELLKINSDNFAFDKDDNSVENIYKKLSNEQRDIAYIAEYLTGYYLLKLTRNKDYKYKKADTISYASSKVTQEQKMNIICALRQRHLKEKELKNG